MKPSNLLIIMSDEHNPKFLGCRGHAIVKTPNIDRLAARGVRFDAAYTPCPVCVPARAAFATGKYVHQIATWDNAMPFDGSMASWHSLLRERGHQVVSIGKLHFRSAADDNGFSDEQIGMHIIDGAGDLLGLIRDDDMPRRGGAYKMAKLAGPGESMYTTYDRDITARAQVWLREHAARHTDRPWVLFVSLVCPHFPLTAPPEHFYRYYDQDLPLPLLYDQRHAHQHPYIEDYRRSFAYDDHFETPDMVKRAQAGYLGLCSFLDENVGKILGALDDAGLTEATRVVYTSDHGDNVGNRGLWGKSTMYDDAVGVPLVIAGPALPEGTVVDTPVNLLDLYPFIMDCAGERDGITVTSEHPGGDLSAIIRHADRDRTVFSEYHGMGSRTAAFMIRKGAHKLVYYVGYPPQLFDLEEDPDELNDLAGNANARTILDDLVAELRRICDPEAVDREAKARQAELLAASGGKEAVIRRGDLGFSVPPGFKPQFD
ncbi:MAG: sulfatase-like hydrolase/transferase [Hyphomicrobiaceae bacterium]